MILSISGKIGSGKDTVGKIIQYLIDSDRFNYKISEQNYNDYLKNKHNLKSYWEIHKWADSLKDIVCILTGCTREQLEDIDFKNSLLPDEWIRYGYADGFIKKYIGNGEMSGAIMNNKQCSKEEYEEHYKINWQTAYKTHLTYRQLLQVLGTDLFRNQLHNDIWVNALMSKYKPNLCSGVTHCALAGKPKISCWNCPEYPNWIITDTRFPNEADAVKSKGGINIRVQRDMYKDMDGNIIPIQDVPIKERNKYLASFKEHESETALDNYEFDYIIDNNETIEELIEKVKEILIKEKIL